MTDTTGLFSVGVPLFVLAPMLLRGKNYLAKSGNVLIKPSSVPISIVKRPNSSLKTSFTEEDIKESILKLEEIIQRDEGKRGIKEIFLPPGELFNAAKEMVSSRKVVIITGFPCLLDYSPPTETDGPLGALAIAKSLLVMGKQVSILTDECNEDVLLACVAGSNLSKYATNLTLQSFPPLEQFTTKDYKRLDAYNKEYDLFIAIERAGPNYEGFARTMRNRDMTHLVAPLEMILSGNCEGTEAEDEVSSKNHVDVKPMKSIGVGDGGNEVGMGKVYHKILASNIPNAKEIACVVPTDHLIITSVSNWGGYALAAAASLLSCGSNTREANQTVLNAHLPTNDEELSKCQRMIDAGARDGLTAQNDLFVDGMPLSESIRVLDELRNVLEC